MLLTSISIPGTGRTILIWPHLIIYGAAPKTDISAPKNINASAAKMPT